MKPHFKPLANHLQTTWHKAAMPIVLMASLFAGMASASVPLAWQVTPRNPAPVAFDRHHGETLEFRCTFTGFGELPFGQVADIRLWYQTNGMAAEWWSVPASVSSNVLSAIFPPAADPGADRLALFFGAPSNAYASAVLRLRPSPGFLPNVLPPPDATSWATELAALRSLIDYSPSNSTLVATIESTEIDPTVPAWAKSETPPASMSTNTVCYIVTNDVPVSGEFTSWKIESPTGSALPSGLAVVWGYFPGIMDYAEPYTGWYLEYNGQPNDSLIRPYAEDISATNLISAGDGGYAIIATRQQVTRNALGMARASDLPPLTNGIPESIASISSRLSLSAQASSNYTDKAIAAFTPAPSGRSWNRPNEWTLAYEPILAPQSSTFDSITTNECDMVFSNAIARTVRGLSARVYPEGLDPFAEASPLPVTLSIPGGSADGGIVSVPSNGIYHVVGVNTSGEARDVPVPFAAGAIKEKVVSTYVADKDATARKLANAFSALMLANMSLAGKATYIGETNRFSVWRMDGFSPTFAWPGVGNTTPYAIAPRMMVTAAHYPGWNIDRWAYSATFTNWVSGGTFTVTKGKHVKLAEWAATNGFTAAEIAAAGDVSDIAMIPITEGEIPSECCPWFASVEWMAEHYTNVVGLCAWTITQGDAYWSPPANRNSMLWPIPVVLHGGSLTAANAWMSAGAIRPGDVMPRADIAEMIGVYNFREWYEIRGGDSGKPVWICDFTSGERRDILVSHFHTVGSGPNWFAAMPMVKAFCAAHGTSIKEMP